MILVFSGTGNSRYVAKAIAERTGESIFSINDAMKSGAEFSSADSKLIFVMPTYAWRIPKVAEKWIGNTKFAEGGKAWFVMTCGGEIGNAAKYNKALCEDKGFEYMGSIGVVMPDNYIIMFKDESQEKADGMLSASGPVIESVVKTISLGEALPTPRNNLYDRLMSSLVNPAFYKNVKADLFIAGESCTACGKCVSVCPLNNVSLKNGSPVWGKSCTHCMACISYCPACAIEYGKKTIGKRRYSYESYFGETKQDIYEK